MNGSLRIIFYNLQSLGFIFKLANPVLACGLATIYGTYSLRDPAIFGLLSHIDVCLFVFLPHIHKEAQLRN